MDLNPQEPGQTKGIEKVTGSVPRLDLFDSEKKARFLSFAREFGPNISRCAAAVGVTPATVWNHRKSDPLFNKSLHEINEAVCDAMESTMREQGVQPKGFLDRMAYLRAHRPELYDRAKVVRVEGWKMGDGERRNRLAGLEGAIDGEIVKTGLDRKAKRDYAKQRALKQGERGAAGTEGQGGK